jgi:RNA polymerase sigma-70 factor (ECF subfamily)
LAHADWVRALAGRLVADSARADDVAQDTWVAAIESPPRDARNPKGWLASIVRNTARELGRGERRREGRERAVAKPEACVPSSEELVRRAHLQREIAGHVVALDEPYRTVVLLRWYEGLLPREIAARLGRPIDTVSTQLARAHERLRERLDREHGDRSTWSALVVGIAERHAAAGAGVAAGTIGGILVSTGWKIGISVAAVVVLGVAMWRGTPGPRAIDLATRPGDADELARQGGAESAVSVADSGARAERTSAGLTGAADPVTALARDGLVQNEERGRVVDEHGKPIAGFRLLALDRRLPRAGPDGILGSMGETLVSPAELASMRANPETVDAFVRAHPVTGLREAILGHGLRSEVTTDAQGRYAVVFPAMDESWHSVESADPGWMLFTEGFDRSTDETVRIAAPRIIVAGEVVGEDGAPIEGAEVTMSIHLHNLREMPIELGQRSVGIMSADMSAGGKFRFEHMPCITGWSFTAHCPGWEPGHRRIPRASSEHMRIVLKRVKPTPKVSGVVLDAEGRPAAFAHVMLGNAAAQTGLEGRFVLTTGAWREDMDLVAAKQGTMAAVMPDFGREIASTQGDIAGLVLRLGPTPLTIEGRVLSATGEPCADWEVDVYDGTPAGRFGTFAEGLSAGREMLAPAPRTKKSGKFRVDGLSERTYRVRALSPGKRLMVLSEPVAAGTEGLVLKVPSDAVRARVTGRVISRKGDPVAGAWVSVEARTGENEGSRRMGLHGGAVETDELGRFVLTDVPRYHAFLTVTVGKNRDEPIVLAPESSGENLEITVSRMARFRVELSAADETDAIEVVDAQGTKLLMHVHQSFDLQRLTRVPRDEDGFPPCETDEGAAAIVFLRGGSELRRVPVALSLDETNVIKP